MHVRCQVGLRPGTALHPPALGPQASLDPWATVWLTSRALPRTPGIWNSPGRLRGTVLPTALSAKAHPLQRGTDQAAPPMGEAIPQGRRRVSAVGRDTDNTAQMSPSHHVQSEGPW